MKKQSLTQRAPRRLTRLAASGLVAAGMGTGAVVGAVGAAPASAAPIHDAAPAHNAAPGGPAHGPDAGHDGSHGPSHGPGNAGGNTAPGQHQADPPAVPQGGNAGGGPSPAVKGQGGPGAANVAPAAGPAGGHGSHGGPAGGPKGPNQPGPGKNNPPAPPAGKGPKGHPQAAGTAGTAGCSEDSFLGSATPAAGTAVGPGSTIGATYSDEKVLNTTTLPPTLTLTGPTGTVSLPLSYTAAKTVKLSAVLPTLDQGTYTATLTAWDSDQNKAGGDCGVASWTFTVNGPNTPNTPPVNPPVVPNPPATPPANPPASPVTPTATPTASPAPTVPTQVLGETITPPAPVATASPARGLAFTGSETGLLGSLGLGLIGAGGFLVRGARRRRVSRFR